MLDRVARSVQISYEGFQALKLSDKARSIWDLVNFAWGFIGFHNLVEDLSQDQRVTVPTDPYADYPLWQQRAFKIADFLSNLSLILGSMTTRPVVALWNLSARTILSPQQLESFFGRQGALPGEKVYSTLSMASFLLGLPSTLKTCYNIYMWVNHSYSQMEERKSIDEEDFDSYTPSYSPLPIRKEDAFVTMKTISETAQHILRTPHK